jgi:hypothetical protein
MSFSAASLKLPNYVTAPVDVTDIQFDRTSSVYYCVGFINADTNTVYYTVTFDIRMIAKFRIGCRLFELLRTNSELPFPLASMTVDRTQRNVRFIDNSDVLCLFWFSYDSAQTSLMTEFEKSLAAASSKLIARKFDNPVAFAQLVFGSPFFASLGALSDYEPNAFSTVQPGREASEMCQSHWRFILDFLRSDPDTMKDDMALELQIIDLDFDPTGSLLPSRVLQILFEESRVYGEALAQCNSFWPPYLSGAAGPYAFTTFECRSFVDSTTPSTSGLVFNTACLAGSFARDVVAEYDRTLFAPCVAAVAAGTHNPKDRVPASHPLYAVLSSFRRLVANGTPVLAWLLETILFVQDLDTYLDQYLENFSSNDEDDYMEIDSEVSVLRSYVASSSSSPVPLPPTRMPTVHSMQTQPRTQPGCRLPYPGYGRPTSVSVL